MKREILISMDANEKQVAILEDGRLEEFYIERADAERMFGNIYKGRVKTVIPGMGAAFVDLGTRKDGFLYVTDALKSPLDLDAEFDERVQQEERKRERIKRIDEVLKVGQEVIVQIVKEPIGNKGPRLTTYFSLPARYLVMMPGEEKIGVSRRIEDRRERERIRGIFQQTEIPKGVGFIVRTAGEGKGTKEFSRDIRYLVRLWKKIHASLPHKKAPSLIHQELDLVERIIRDHLVEETDTLVVDHKEIYRKVQRFLELYLPGQKVNVIFHQDRVPVAQYVGCDPAPPDRVGPDLHVGNRRADVNRIRHDQRPPGIKERVTFERLVRQDFRQRVRFYKGGIESNCGLSILYAQ